MGNEMVMEIDAKAMAEFWEDHEGMGMVPEKPQIQSCAEIFKRYVPVYDRQEKMSDITKNPLGQVNETSPEKLQTAKSGLGSWIKDNPIQSLLIGALIGGGIYALYKHFNKEEEIANKKKAKKGNEKNRKSLKELWEEKEIEDDNLPSDINENEQLAEFNEPEANEASDSGDETHSVSRKDLGIGITAALGGSILGAALGNASLIASIPVVIAGIWKSNLGITLAGAGMALAMGYNQEDGNEGNLICQSLNRACNYLENLLDKLISPFNEEERPGPGDKKTMLGYIPASKIHKPIFQ
jgi:hypothetical protein